MIRDPLQGKTFSFVFTDGQMAGQTFIHTFAADGTVTFSRLGATTEKPDAGLKYAFVPLRERLCVFSYRSSDGYTLTAVLDFETKKLVAFVSNERMSEVAQGIFEEVRATTLRMHRVAHTHN